MGRDGSHIHFTLESPTFGRQWAPTVYLSDDALVTKRRREQSAAAGEFGWVRDVESVEGVQRIDVKFRLKEKADF
jgi:protocatechuate 3,4-dioxygenase beta subunit